jgi:hypothetical protein
MRSVWMKGNCRGGAFFRVRSGGVRGGGIGPSPFPGTAHGADNGIGTSGQDVASAGRPGTSEAAFRQLLRNVQPNRRPSAVKV